MKEAALPMKESKIRYTYACDHYCSRKKPLTSESAGGKCVSHSLPGMTHSRHRYCTSIASDDEALFDKPHIN